MQNALRHYLSWLLVGLVTVVTFVNAANVQFSPHGLVVEEIAADSPAAKAGLRVGDRLLTYDGKPLTSSAVLLELEVNALGESKKEVALRVQRGEETLTMSLTVLGLWGIQTRPQLQPAVLTLYTEGRAALQARSLEEAMDKWTAAAKAALERGDKAAAIWLYGRVGETYERQQRCEEASVVLAAAWKLLRDSSDAEQMLTRGVLRRCSVRFKFRGSDAHARGDLQAANDYFTRALAIHELLAPNSLSVASGLNDLGAVAAERGDLRAAQDYYGRALAIQERLAPNSPGGAGIFNGLGVVAYYRGDLPTAHDYYSRALAIRERVAPDSLEVAGSLNNLGAVAHARGNFQAAHNYYSRALAIQERLAPNSLDVAGSLGNLGMVARARGDLQAAHDYLSRDLAIRERLAPNSLGVAESLNGLGNVAANRGDLQAAGDYYSRALAIQERLAPDSLDVAGSLGNLGNVAYARGDLQAAHDYHSRDLVIRERLASNSLDVAICLGDLGNIAYARGNLQAAHGYYSRALTIEQRLAPDSLAVAATLNDLGDLALDERRFPNALSLFTQAVKIVEDHRRQIPSTEARALLVARYIRPYAGLLRTHLALGDRPAAFATIERARARSLVELLAERQLDFRSDASTNLLNQQKELDQKRSAAYSALAKLDEKKDGAQIKELQAELARYAVQQRELEAQIRRASPKFASLLYPTPLDLKGAQAALDEGTLLLAYYVDEKETHLFAVTKTSLKVITLPVGKVGLNKQVEKFRNAVATNRIGTTNDGQKLYDILIRPAQEWVNQAQRILICSDRPLHVLPFAALVSQTEPNLRYFIEDKPLHMIVSMTIYAEMRKQAAAGNAKHEMRLLAFGDAIYTKEQAAVERQNLRQAAQERKEEGKEKVGSDLEFAYLQRRGLKLPPLPETRKEVEGIAKLYGNSATTKLGQEATKTTAKQESQGYNILHFAVHAWADEQMGLSSGLALSQPEALGWKIEESDNGLWQAWEIFEQPRLNADLVVLSACQTGMGQEVQGEGIIGLTRAFQHAGAKSLVVSLWEVSDASTAELMIAFHREFRRGASKDVALRKAMEVVRRNPKWRHPFYWSPFILVGDWQ